MAESDFYLPDAGRAFPTAWFLLAVDLRMSLCVLKSKKPTCQSYSRRWVLNAIDWNWSARPVIPLRSKTHTRGRYSRYRPSRECALRESCSPFVNESSPNVKRFFDSGLTAWLKSASPKFQGACPSVETFAPRSSQA